MHQESSGMGPFYRVRTILFVLIACSALQGLSAQEANPSVSPTPNPYPTLTIPSPVRTPEATPTPNPEVTPTATPTPEPPKLWNLSGIVVNTNTGAPIRRAVVVLAKRGLVAEPVAPGNGALTDIDGRFHFDGLQGNVQLIVRKPGYFTQTELQHPESRDAILTVPPGSDPVVINLVPAGGIAGTVSDQNGETIEGVRIRLMKTELIGGRKVWKKLEIAKITNEDGEFRASNLAPGTYRLATELTPKPQITLARTSNRLSQTVYAASYYPGTTDASASTPIEIGSGETARADLRLREEPAYTVSGTILGFANGQSVSLQVLNSFDDVVSLETQFDPQSGRFQFKPITAGIYRIEARSQDSRGRGLYAITPINVRGPISDMRVVLHPMLTIPVVFQTQSRRKSSQLDSYPVDAGIFSARPLADGKSFTEKWSDHGTDSAQLPLAIRDVEPGVYAVELHANDGWYVYSATYGSTDLFRDPLQVTARADAIEIALRNDGATLKGAVQSPGKTGKTTVFLVRNNCPALPPTMVNANEKGEFEITDLAPGDYTALAMDQINGLEYTNPIAMQPYVSRGTHVKLTANDQSSVNLELIRRTE